MQKSYEKSRNREKNLNKPAAAVRDPSQRHDFMEAGRFVGNNAMKENPSQASRAHWNKLWVPPTSNGEWGKGGQPSFQQFSGSNVHPQWNVDLPPFHQDFQFHERRNPENHFSHGPPPMGDAMGNNPHPWGASNPNGFPPMPNQLEQLEELHAYYQFKLKKLQKQKKQSHEDILQLNQLASLLKESLAMHELSMKQQQQDFGFQLLEPLFDPAPSIRANEVLRNGTVFFDQSADFLPNQQVNWRPNDRLGNPSSKEIWGNPSAPLSIPNRGRFSPEPFEYGRKSPGSGSPKAVSDFPGLNFMAREFSQPKFKTNSVFLPSQDELDLHLAMVQIS